MNKYTQQLEQKDIMEFINSLDNVDMSCIHKSGGNWHISIIIERRTYHINYILSDFEVICGESFLLGLMKNYQPVIERAWLKYLAKKFPNYQNDYNAYRNSFKL